MQLGSDGLVRLTLNEVLSIQMVHLTSGVDQEVPGQHPPCGTPTSLTGYTEWRSLAEPAIVMGWDWCSVYEQGRLRLTRVGLPRCNIMLIDHTREDLDWTRQLEILGTVIDAMDWDRETQATVAARYR
jgi:hypothetical protein